MLGPVLVEQGQEKSIICNKILRALPQWFGIEKAIVDYTRQVEGLPFYAIYDGGSPGGFVALKVHNTYTAEVFVLGLLKEYHRRGMGRKLIKACEEYCRGKGLEFLTVKTLDASRESGSYEKTRHFYLAMGFRPLQVFATLWDEDNPCLFMAKYLGNKG